MKRSTRNNIIGALCTYGAFALLEDLVTSGIKLVKAVREVKASKDSSDSCECDACDGCDSCDEKDFCECEPAAKEPGEPVAPSDSDPED